MYNYGKFCNKHISNAYNDDSIVIIRKIAYMKNNIIKTNSNN